MKTKVDKDFVIEYSDALSNICRTLGVVYIHVATIVESVQKGYRTPVLIAKARFTVQDSGVLHYEVEWIDTHGAENSFSGWFSQEDVDAIYAVINN